jgi:hypothetical protein
VGYVDAEAIDTLREWVRVLKPGGRVAVSDMVLLKPLPDTVRTAIEAWVGCIAGASLVDDLRRARIRHALLVTSTDHMDRALLVGRIVAGSRGIQLTPVPVDCRDQCVPEGRRKVWGDGVRAGLWVLTGRDLRGWAAEHLPGWLGPDGAGRSGPDPAGR